MWTTRIRQVLPSGGCGGFTGKQYAYRFNETEPTVWCNSCKRKIEEGRKRQEKIERRGHKKNIRCRECYSVISTEKYHSDSDTEEETCADCYYEVSEELDFPGKVCDGTQSGEEILDLLQKNYPLGEVYDEKPNSSYPKEDTRSNEEIIDNQFIYD